MRQSDSAVAKFDELLRELPGDGLIPIGATFLLDAIVRNNELVLMTSSSRPIEVGTFRETLNTPQSLYVPLSQVADVATSFRPGIEFQFVELDDKSHFSSEEWAAFVCCSRLKVLLDHYNIKSQVKFMLSRRRNGSPAFCGLVAPGSYVISVDFAIVQSLRRIFRALVLSPSIATLLEIEPSGIQKGPFGSFKSDADLVGFLITTADIEVLKKGSDSAGTFLTQYALANFIDHEFHHIRLGHLEYVRKHNRVDQIDEDRELTDYERTIRQALELDADWNALGTIFSARPPLLGVADYHVKSEHKRRLAAMVTLLVVFKFSMMLTGEKAALFSDRSHPGGLFRTIASLMFVEQVLLMLGETFTIDDLRENYIIPVVRAVNEGMDYLAGCETNPSQRQKLEGGWGEYEQYERSLVVAWEKVRQSLHPLGGESLTAYRYKAQLR